MSKLSSATGFTLIFFTFDGGGLALCDGMADSRPAMRYSTCTPEVKQSSLASSLGLVNNTKLFTCSPRGGGFAATTLAPALPAAHGPQTSRAVSLSAQVHQSAIIQIPQHVNPARHHACTDCCGGRYGCSSSQRIQGHFAILHVFDTTVSRLLN